MTLAAILAALGGLAASVGPLALGAGPFGLALAWLGSAFGNRTIKVIATVAGIAIAAASIVALTVYLQNLKRDSAAYHSISVQLSSLEARYGCAERPAHEQPLTACLASRDRDNALAQAREIARQRVEAAAAQARQSAEEFATQRWLDAEEEAIAAGLAHDGPVPGVLLDSWARERAARGVK